ncbi:hypothetical protein TYRP_019433 [Tyrophagus putrescentiae]|nr:hypothetical protein TYRP_019433 [Tyrophagus putrescentiae]
MSSKSSKKEDGHRVSAAAEAGAGSGRSFFGRLRAGFNAVQQEVATAEELTAAAEKQINSLSQQQPLPDNNPTALTPLYFEPEMAMLTNIALHYNEAVKLQETLLGCPLNVDPIEERLLALRGRLLKLEENPRLLRTGYRPYLHERSPQEVRQQQQQQQQPKPKQTAAVAVSKCEAPQPKRRPGTPRFSKSYDDANGQSAETPTTTTTTSTISTPTPPPTLPIDTLHQSAGGRSIPIRSGSSSSSKPVEPTVVTNREIAHCLSRLSRWNTVTITSSENALIPSSPAVPVPVPSSAVPLPTKPFTRSCTFVKPKTPPVPFSSSSSSSSSAALITPVPPGSVFKPTISKSNISSSSNYVPRNTTFTLPLHQQSFPYAATPIALLMNNGSNGSLENSSVEYETVEFTPGMTSRVPKNR